MVYMIGNHHIHTLTSFPQEDGITLTKPQQKPRLICRLEFDSSPHLEGLQPFWGRTPTRPRGSKLLQGSQQTKIPHAVLVELRKFERSLVAACHMACCRFATLRHPHKLQYGQTLQWPFRGQNTWPARRPETHAADPRRAGMPAAQIGELKAAAVGPQTAVLDLTRNTSVKKDGSMF